MKKLYVYADFDWLKEIWGEVDMKDLLWLLKELK